MIYQTNLKLLDVFLIKLKKKSLNGMKCLPQFVVTDVDKQNIRLILSNSTLFKVLIKF